MENQIKTVVCPNCGANTTNLHNCEYCGSALVQSYITQASGVDAEVEELKATLNACDPEGKIENALRKITKLWKFRGEGITHILYVIKDANPEYHYLIEIIDEPYHSFELTVNGSYLSDDTRAKINNLVCKLNYKVSDTWIEEEDFISFQIGMDRKVLSQIVYLILSWQFGEFNADNILYYDDIDSDCPSGYDANGDLLDEALVAEYKRKNDEINPPTVDASAEENNVTSSNFSDSSQGFLNISEEAWMIIIGVGTFVFIGLVMLYAFLFD